MKKILPLLFSIFLGSAFIISCAQEKEKKEIKKEIRVEQENDNTTVTITETKDGKVTEKILTGEDAEQFVEDNHGSEHNSFYFKNDDKDGDHVIIVKEIDNDGDDEHHVWVSEDGDDMNFEMVMGENEMTAEVENLLENIDDMSKEEIKSSLEEMMKEAEEMEKEMIIKMESIHEHEGNVKVNVEEEDGVITIEKTVDGKTTIETIEIGDDHKSGERIYIIKTDGNDEDDE
jgi:hypothetical protein